MGDGLVFRLSGRLRAFYSAIMDLPFEFERRTLYSARESNSWFLDTPNYFTEHPAIVDESQNGRAGPQNRRRPKFQRNRE